MVVERPKEDPAKDDFISEIEQECKIEFMDPRFLSVMALDSDHAALDYFYQSPFYLKHRDRALNEHIRAGQVVDSYQVGLIFQVTYNNLDDLTAQYPPDSPARTQFYNTAAIFHVTLFSRDLGHNGVQSTPIKVYYILQGSIFMCPPFGLLVRNKVHQSMRDFERFYDRLNDITSWSITNGYIWNPKPRMVNREIENICNRYGFKEVEESGFLKNGNMNIFHIKPQDPTAARIVLDEIKNQSSIVTSTLS